MSGEPQSLIEALPNAVTTFRTANGNHDITWSDSVVIGKVTSVDPGSAIEIEATKPGEDSDGGNYREVDFDDPKANSRSVLVTIDVEWSKGTEDETVQFRIGAGDADPEKYMASLRGLGKVVVLLDERENGRYKGDLFPRGGASLIGTVDTSGSIVFPGLPVEESEYLGGIDTVAELRLQVAKEAIRFVRGALTG